MRNVLLFVGLVSIVLLSGCVSEEVKITCRLPRQDFTESDIVGTWWAGYVSSPKRDDFLIIREDGFYKQIIHLEAYSIDYESDWLPWRIEYFDDGIPYLHLQGLRLCAHDPSLSCDQAGGGEKDWDAFNENEWYDSCRDKWLLQKDEGIVRILGAVYDGWTNDGFELAALTSSPLDSWVYRLQNPESPRHIPPHYEEE